MEKLAIYFLKNLTQSFSGHCFGITHSKISLYCDSKKEYIPSVLCIPRNNIYIKEIEIDTNKNIIGTRLNVNKNKFTVPENPVPENPVQNGGFVVATFVLGIIGGMMINSLVQVMEMDRQNEEERKRIEEENRKKKENKKRYYFKSKSG
jgi:hypothetical protein